MVGWFSAHEMCIRDSIKAAAVEPDEPDRTRGRNGGCNSGAALPLLAAMAVLIIRKKR